jgi:hypothetical protein
VEMEEWSGKEKVMKQKGKLRKKKEAYRTRHTEETKNHRERRKREGKEVKVGYRKITIEVVQWRWNKERGRLEIFQ